MEAPVPGVVADAYVFAVRAAREQTTTRLRWREGQLGVLICDGVAGQDFGAVDVAELAAVRAALVERGVGVRQLDRSKRRGWRRFVRLVLLVVALAVVAGLAVAAGRGDEGAPFAELDDAADCSTGEA